MSLKDLLMDDLKVAMRDKDVVKKSVVTMLRAAIKQIEVDQRIELDDEAIIEIIAKQIKQKNNAIVEFDNGNRQDLVDLTKNEIEFLMKYLPEQLSPDEVKVIVDEAIATTGATTMKDMGKVMGIVTNATKGKAEGKLISDLVKKALS
ncbi:GatB/YqeY domain-containing protein [Fusibacter bizertensis]|uniref:GatB/YqeY domain-containing protein n=1 Tax=Fusibacter bizertensis TaxID=1488331 RepID=A0ABT6NDB3_9FIRM|nr:GatB/YqeY domain-containing protein [Fusibacter bizertensis]MDH8678406.1 GatB/YqeY domain-containing protein [Fusibacter bizertensis]